MSQIFLGIFNRSISAGYIVLAILLLRLLLKKAPKWITAALWSIVAVRLLCPISVESALSLIPSAETVSPTIMTDSTPTIHTGISALNSVINPIVETSFTPAPGDSANPLQIWVPLLTAIWAAGIGAMLLYTVISYLRIRRKIGTAILLRDNIYRSENVASPFVLGIVKPRIYLPFCIEERDVEHVVAHEKAHIRRKDHLWKPFGFLLLTLHWFNPLIWLGYILLCRDIELACDEKVIKALDRDARADYSQALLSCSVNRRTIAACPLAFGEEGVKNRIKAVLHYKKPAFWVIIAAVIACTAAAVCFLTDPLRKGEADPAPLSGQIHTEYEGVYITIASIEKDEGGQSILNAVWHNDTDKEVTFGERFIIAQKSGGVLPVAEFAEDAVFNSIGYLLKPHDTQKKSYTTEHYDLSQTGEYRLVVPFLVKEGDEYISYQTWFAFEVGDILSTAYLRQQYPQYFDIDDAGGLDIYVWQMAPNSYSFGLLPHSEEPRDWAELLQLRDVDAQQMRAILSDYNTDETDIHIILWQNPLSSHIAPWGIITEGETAEERLQNYGEPIRRMLFGETAEPARAYGSYYLVNDNDAIRFSVTLKEDGTFRYYEGSFSSHIGMGEYTIQDNIVTLVDAQIPGVNGPLTRTYKFRFEDGKLLFLAEESDSFMYRALPDGAEFVRESDPEE